MRCIMDILVTSMQPLSMLKKKGHAMPYTPWTVGLFASSLLKSWRVQTRGCSWQLTTQERT
ncbi:hypothetical protein CsSME_00036551 [Camellia sinensis var. sinensis]